MYSKLRETTGDIHDYTAKAELSISMQRSQDSEYTDIEYVKEILIPYNIDIEGRTWGIHSLSLLATTTIRVPYEIVRFADDGNESDREQKEVSVDLSTAEIEWVDGGFYGISELVLSLTSGGGLAASKIVCVYINPSR